MTKYRHMSPQTLKIQGVTISDIAKKLNTSEGMIRKIYAHSSNEPCLVQRHIERYKDYYTREDKKKA
jgi:hypothetical protein